MAFCPKCGEAVTDDLQFCPKCGVNLKTGEAPKQEGSNFEETARSTFDALNQTEDTTQDFNADDILKNKGLSVLSYLGILFLIPLLAAKDSRFARFHVNQGLVLFLVNILFQFVLGIFRSVIGSLTIGRLVSSFLGFVGGIFLIVLAVIGIINAAKGRAKKLPLIGTISLLK